MTDEGYCGGDERPGASDGARGGSQGAGSRGEAHFEAEIRDGELLLRPAVLVPREDAWAYTPEHRALLARARADAAQGRTRRLDEGALRELTGSEER